jgi:hypothetical protein
MWYSAPALVHSVVLHIIMHLATAKQAPPRVFVSSWPDFPHQARAPPQVLSALKGRRSGAYSMRAHTATSATVAACLTCTQRGTCHLHRR